MKTNSNFKYLGIIPVIISLVAYIISKNDKIFVLSIVLMFVYLTFVLASTIISTFVNRRTKGNIEKSEIMDL